MESQLKEKSKKLKGLDDIFKRCAQRSSRYDRENRFFTEDFEELKKAGYLLMPLPKVFGGYGMNLHEVVRKQRQLAYHAAPTALALNMHLYWVGLAADLWRQGDTSLEWLLIAASKGEVFAAGHAESGNHLPVTYSTTKAEKVKGGYTFTGHKQFGSLSPAWTFFGIHGMDDTDPQNPKIIHGFMPRNSEGFEVKETWDDVLGMRATRSDDTILKGVFVPDKYIVRELPAGFKGADAFLLGIFVWALMGFGNIYCGLAQNAFDLILSKIQNKKSLPYPNGMKNHPYVQSEIAKMYMKLEAIKAHLDSVSKDWAKGKNHGDMWTLKIINAKRHAVEKAFEIVRTVFELSGGYGIFPASGIERLYRDASIGILHPANALVTEEITGGALCGADLDAQPRWG
jgi:alkylation response protein AidB-like acyl-CoA dehydrogenase